MELDYKSLQGTCGGVSFRVGKGDTSIWFDGWSVNGHLCNRVDYVHIQDVRMTLRDIHAEVTWHWNMIATSISMDLNNEICSIFINDALPDTMIWDPSQSGTYYAIHGNLDVGSPITRTHQTLPMGNHKSLPTNAFRLHTHISTDSLCCRCGLHEENILHLLRDPPLGCVATTH